MKSGSRTLIIGDIHGCHREFEDILEKAKITPQDTVISVGDMVCKGPSTVKVLDRAMNMKNFQAVRGNHENSLLRYWKSGKYASIEKDYQREAFEEMGRHVEKYMQFIASWPLYIETPEYIVLHAGVVPGKTLAKQELSDLVTLRTLADGRPWYEAYTDKKLIVHGHWARNGLIVRDNVIGLDSGCVYGKKLSAVILPERKVISVSARKAYSPL